MAKKAVKEKKNRLSRTPIEVKYRSFVELKKQKFPKKLNRIAIKERILKRRTELELSQVDTATFIGMRPQGYYMAEKTNPDKVFFTMDQIYNLKHVLGLSYDHIFEGLPYEEKREDFPENPMKLDWDSIKNRVVMERFAMGMTQHQFAELIGMSRQSYYKAERIGEYKDQCDFTVEQVYNLKHILQVSYEYLLEGIGDRKIMADDITSEENQKLKNEIVNLELKIVNLNKKIKELEGINNNWKKNMEKFLKKHT